MINLPWFADFSKDLIGRMRVARLHHALLLTGGEGIGKHLLAKSLSKQLLCKQLGDDNAACGKCQACQLFAAANHPDFYWLTTDKTQIGVDLIRKAIESLNSKAQLGHNKVLVIPNAHMMSESAANALLKTLEEPTQFTYIVLITHQPNRLLPTILSRCEKHLLSTPKAEVSLAWLVDETTKQPQLNPDNRVVDEALLHAYGMAPITTLDSLIDSESLQFSDFSQKFSAMLSGDLDIFTLATAWQSSSERVIQWLQRNLRQRLENASHSQAGQTWRVIEYANQAALEVRHPGTNKAMLLFQLLTQVANLEVQCS